MENNEAHAAKAIELGLVDEVCSLEEAIKQSDIIIVAMPVNAAEDLLPQVLDEVDKQVVMDVGSIKQEMMDSIKHHPKRERFVPTHPMWGTEYSGPEAAVKDAFINKATVICNKEESDADAVRGR